MNKIHIILAIVLTIIISSCNTNNSINIDTVTSKDSISSIEKEIAKTKFGILVNDYIIQKNSVKKNEFFSNILQNNGISYPRVIEAVNASKEIFDVKYMRTGDTYYTFRKKDTTNKTDYIIYHLNKTNYVKFDFIDSIIATEHQLPIRIDTNLAEGIIESSPWVSLKNGGYDPMLSMELSDIYAWTIDFYGLQKGDSYKIIYETKFIDSTYIGLGKVLACQFVHFDYNYKAYIFVQDSLEDYFDEEGGSLRRAFLKAPLRYSRISSRFSHSRMHPILKIRRPHHGVDYAA
ncbi:MAG: metalloendopeptidase, partial [Bacteroidetes bacterium]